jgi:murein DD-endopeptidase MepM/ murein hydrolase activator NlpD
MRFPLERMKIRPCQFGRYDPLSNTFGKVRINNTKPHQGWDLIAPPGSICYAISDGELRYIDEGKTGLGLKAILMFNCKDLTYYAVYAHLSEKIVGDCSVKEGAKIAKTGMTGNASKIPVSEAHLHFEIRTKAIAGQGLDNRIDPGEVFGYEFYSCKKEIFI